MESLPWILVGSDIPCSNTRAGVVLPSRVRLLMVRESQPGLLIKNITESGASHSERGLNDMESCDKVVEKEESPAVATPDRLSESNKSNPFIIIFSVAAYESPPLCEGEYRTLIRTVLPSSTTIGKLVESRM